MYHTHKSLNGFVRGALNLLFGPDPSTTAYADAIFDTMKLKDEEKRKPEGQRDEWRLLELHKQVLRMKAERYQALHRQLQAAQHLFLQPPRTVCCNECLIIRQRLAASCEAAAAWYKACAVACIEHLQAVQQGKPPSTVPSPPFELHLPEGVPEELPPSLDRCSRCQGLLDRYVSYELAMRNNKIEGV